MPVQNPRLLCLSRTASEQFTADESDTYAQRCKQSLSVVTTIISPDAGLLSLQIKLTNEAV